MDAVTPLVLGVIASALSETSDSLLGRIRQILMMLSCFALATFSIEYLFDTPILFSAGLFTSAFGFIMLGAIGSRYASIAFASLLIAVYAMLGAAQSVDLVTQPALLLAGAGWNSFLTLIWQVLWPNQPLQQSLAHLFSTLERYLDAKARLFEPVSGFSSHARRLEMARLNTGVVGALNNTKQTLQFQIRRGRSQKANRYLKLYFLAQDIHERISSSHYRYDELGEKFRYSDILFRFHWLIRKQADACCQLGEAIRHGRSYEHRPEVTQAMEDARDSLANLRSEHNPKWLESLTALKFLLRNLTTIERHLQNADNPDLSEEQDTELANNEARSIRDMWQRLRSAMTPDSQLFRHAVRLSVSLTIGYGVIQAFELDRGYWILLTILFVCQPNFVATRQRLFQRMAGTIGGLLLGVPLLYLFPGQEGQLVLMVVCGVAFFATRATYYGWATGFITLLVLFCFSQLGEGYVVILPRLGDTLVGCILSALAVRFILPDWQAHHMPAFMAEAVSRNRDYLDQNIVQYRHGKKDNLAYRSARRAAHNADAALSSAISTMLQEPGKYHAAVDESFRMLVLNHALLGYISALGAHRDRLGDHQIHLLVSEAHGAIYVRLEQVRAILLGQSQVEVQSCDSSLDLKLGKWREQEDEITKLVLQQLYMIHRMLDEMLLLVQKIVGCEDVAPEPPDNSATLY